MRFLRSASRRRTRHAIKTMRRALHIGDCIVNGQWDVPSNGREKDLITADRYDVDGEPEYEHGRFRGAYRELESGTGAQAGASVHSRRRAVVRVLPVES